MDIGENRSVRGLSVSRLTLGTVQFGIPYGLKEDAAGLSAEEAGCALRCARECGITSVDTAAVYGDAEDKIGSWFRASGKPADIVISTKVNALDITSEKALIGSMREQVLAAKRKLFLDCIPVLMIHHFEEYRGASAWFDKAFSVMKEEGHIRLSGVSAYSSEDYRCIADSGMDAVQIPLNILDWRQIENGGLSALAEEGMLIFARSIYLQGLLLRTPKTLEKRMSFAGDVVDRYGRLCESYGLSRRELAMSFVLSLPGVASAVVGCRNPEQIRDNAETLRRCRLLSNGQMEEIREMFGNTEDRITVPMLWPPR